MSDHPFDEDDFLDRLTRRLDPVGGPDAPPTRTDYDLNPAFKPKAAPQLKQAAVLVGLTRSRTGLSVVLTTRTQDMPTHAGQISFPGGKLQASDTGPEAAALRESQEEVGLPPEAVTLFGRSPTYQTVTGYFVTPVVGLIDGVFEPRPDPREVADVFTTPISFLMNPANHERHERTWNGLSRAYYAMPYEGRYIWGATAGMLKALYERLYTDGEGQSDQGGERARA